MGWKSPEVVLLAVALLAAGAGAACADVAVPRTGALLRGEIRVDDAKGQLTVDGEAHALEGILLVEDDDGALRWSAGIGERIEGYRRLVHETRRPELVELTKEAVRARDHVAARRLLDWVRSEGLEGRDERILVKRVESLEKKPRPPDEKRLAEVLRAEERLRAALPELLLDRARRNEADRLRVLRALLREAPEHEAALALVRAAVPEGSPFPEPREWLAWHLDLESRGFTLADPELTELQRARHNWRPDLYGVAAEGMLLVTPLRDLDMVGACALRMRMTIETLATLFRTDHPRARTSKPLTVYLFVDRKNFAERAGYEGAVDVPPYYRWALGHFDFQENLTRLLCPETIRDPANRQLAYTLIHEVARQWFRWYCPRFADKEVYEAGPASGYGLRAGFPAFLAEAGFDLEQGTVDLAHRDTTSVRYVREYEVLDWSRFFLMNMEDVHRMNGEDEELYKAKRERTTYGHMFLFQGAATCHYLYNANGGRKRDALIEYVTNQYLGRQEKLNPRLALGADPDALGAAVVAWCKQ